jgi:hypothetical protein
VHVFYLIYIIGQMSEELKSFIIDDGNLTIEKNKDKIIIKAMIDDIEFQQQSFTKLQEELLLDIMNGYKLYRFDKSKKQLHIDYRANDRTFTDTIQLVALPKENPPDKLEILEVSRYSNYDVYIRALITSYYYKYLQDGRVKKLESYTHILNGTAPVKDKNVALVVSLFEDIKSGKNKNYTFTTTVVNHENYHSYFQRNITINYIERDKPATFSTYIKQKPRDSDDCIIL